MANGYYITLDEDDLHERGPASQELLKPLAKKAVGWEFSKILREHSKVLAAHDGHNLDQDYRDWKFRTINPKLWCSYFELWNPIPATRSWYLYRAYLALFRHKADYRMEELICLHCDPLEVEPRFKKGPHLHISTAEEPICDAHLPLNDCHLEEILTCCESLMKAFENGIKILKSEIIEKYSE